MSIATKNGSIIIKDGKLSEGCGCCGGWYCDVGGACCEGTACTVKPECECQEAGQTFQGVGTTCDSISGACCEGTVCTVKPRCQCQGAGQTFEGVGTTCESISGACCEGAGCTVKPRCQCQGDGKVFKGVGTTCESIQCPKCIWVFGLPSVVVLTLSNCQDLFYGTADFETMNGSYSLPLQSRTVLADPPGTGSGVANYQSIRTDGRDIVASIECLNGKVRYKALAGTRNLVDKAEQERRGNRFYGVQGNFFGDFIDSDSKCFTTSFSGGTVGIQSCFFEMSCSSNPLP
jgi:hypothetical protein